MTGMADSVFLFDVDNTLLDNDRVQHDMGVHLAKYYGEATCERCWELFEKLRQELGYSDYLGALELYRLEALHDPTVLRIATWLVDYSFHKPLYPNAMEVVKKTRRAGDTAILSDGDAVFQPRKVERS